MKPAFTTSGNTRTATALDLHLAAAGFCATSCCKARRESLIKSSADAVTVVSIVKAASSKLVMCFVGFIVLWFVFPSVSAVLLRLLSRVYRTLGLYEHAVGMP